MGIFGTARGVVDNAEGQIDNMSVQMHNKQFELFDKDTLTGSEAKELATTVLSNNSSVKVETFKVTLELTNKDGSDVYIHSSGNVDGNEYDSYDKSGVDLSVNQSAVTYAKKYKNKVEYDNNGIMKSFILKEK